MSMLLYVVFRHRVTNFKPHILSPQKLKLKNSSAHQKEDLLKAHPTFIPIAIFEGVMKVSNITAFFRDSL